MALIERFTPGGNLYPDGSSTFAMLVQFFRRWAENRDSMDQQIVEQAVSATMQDFDSDEAVFAVVDEDGRRTWIEAATDGGPTDYAVSKIAPAVTPAAAETAAAEVGVQDMDTGVTGLSVAIVDEDGRRTWLEANQAGAPTDRTVDTLRGVLQIGETGTATDYRASYDPTTMPVVSGPDIVCWGDSMTQGAGGGGTRYPEELAVLTGRTVHNRGVGGETSVTIAARTGATPLLAIPAGGRIPTSGAVVLNLEPINGETPAPLIQGAAGFNTGTFAGVPGTISRDSTTGVYSFTRATAGDAVPVNRPTPWISPEAEARRGDIAIIWVGQNGPTHARAVADVAAIVQHLNTLGKRFLVIPKPTSTDAQDAQWHDLYGRRVVPIRQYLVKYGLADAGITPTAQDEADMAAGIVPTSLRADSVHFLAPGYIILAGLINDRLRELGWV